MGTKMAPPYACLVVGYLEEVKLFPKVLPIFFNKIECENIQNNFKRNMDDGFVALLKSIKVNLLLKCLNSLHPDIKYTDEQSKISYTNTTQYQFLNFLDISVILHDNNIIETYIFYKPTNSNDYLNYKSHHPKHTKENIPFTLAKRIICFVSNRIIMEIRLQQLKIFLVRCNYPVKIINNGIFKTRLQGPAPQKREKNKIIPFVTTNFANNNFENLLTTLNGILKLSVLDNKLKSIFENTSIVLSQRQPKNILRHISTSSFNKKPVFNNDECKVLKCISKRCKLFSMYFQFVNHFTTSSGKVWYIKTSISCNSKNTIYFLSCNGCDGKTTYIGKTNNIRLGTYLHIYTCRTGFGSDKFDLNKSSACFQLP
ncbi:uncharacterized protein LOC136083998 [Hydra vulgaris]|uniref:Uncharacterized protein LOC136083998 n=1 Tax=Hydra vulgaris TaxID=6087 RepID=A0ABM4CEF0_HYDVU